MVRPRGSCRPEARVVRTGEEHRPVLGAARARAARHALLGQHRTRPPGPRGTAAGAAPRAASWSDACPPGAAPRTPRSAVAELRVTSGHQQVDHDPRQTPAGRGPGPVRRRRFAARVPVGSSGGHQNGSRPARRSGRRAGGRRRRRSAPGGGPAPEQPVAQPEPVLGVAQQIQQRGVVAVDGCGVDHRNRVAAARKSATWSSSRSTVAASMSPRSTMTPWPGPSAVDPMKLAGPADDCRSTGPRPHPTRGWATGGRGDLIAPLRVRDAGHHVDRRKVAVSGVGDRPRTRGEDVVYSAGAHRTPWGRPGRRLRISVPVGATLDCPASRPYSPSAVVSAPDPGRTRPLRRRQESGRMTGHGGRTAVCRRCSCSSGARPPGPAGSSSAGGRSSRGGPMLRLGHGAGRARCLLLGRRRPGQRSWRPGSSAARTSSGARLASVRERTRAGVPGRRRRSGRRRDRPIGRAGRRRPSTDRAGDVRPPGPGLR